MSLSKHSDKKLRNSSETDPGGGTGAGHSIIESRTLRGGEGDVTGCADAGCVTRSSGCGARRVKYLLRVIVRECCPGVCEARI
jgi:hypothetical protein